MRPIVQFAAQSKDLNLLAASSSGGAFGAIAKTVLADGGVVFGAAWDKGTRSVRHVGIERASDLRMLHGSKYVVSDLSGVYAKISSFLKVGRTVLFSGTPCQVAALRKSYGKYPNLILCSIFCQSNVSRKIFESYLNTMEEQHGCRVAEIAFRDKRFGWSSGLVRILFENGEEVCTPHYRNPYMRLFDLGVSASNCCLRCKFRGGSVGGGIMIGDFWGVNDDIDSNIDVPRGVSAILVYDPAALELVRRSSLVLREVRYEDVLKGNRYLERSICPSYWRRQVFIRTYGVLGFYPAYCLSMLGYDWIGFLRRVVKRFFK